MTSFTTSSWTPEHETAGGLPAVGGGRMVPPRSTLVNSPPIPSLDAGKPPATVGNRKRRGADPDRPRAHGRNQHPGLSAAGTAFRRGSGLLGDGLCGWDRAPERANVRLLARGGGRASARDPDLRLRSRSDGRGRSHGRGRRRGHRRHELRLSRAEGDEDRRRRTPDGGSGTRVSRRRGGGGSCRRARHREDAARNRERIARVPRARTAAWGGGRRGAHAPPPLGAADVHRRGRPRTHGRARRARRRPGDRVRRRHVPRESARGAGADQRGSRHGGARRAGKPVGAAGDHRRRVVPPDPRGGGGRARRLHPRGRARAWRAARSRLFEEVLRLVPRPRPVPEAVQAGARPAENDRGGRDAPLRRSTRRGAARRPPRSGAARSRGRGARRPASDLGLRRRLSVRMHADEVDTDPSLVQRLVAGQFPQWSDLPVEPVFPLGTDNANYRLGADKLLRLPRQPGKVEGLERELEWLPVFAPALPIAVPRPLGRGEAAEGFPFPWGVFTWVEGANVGVEEVAPEAAEDLAGLIRALRSLGATDAPPGLRRGTLREHDEWVRGSVAKFHSGHDGEGLLAAWEETLEAPPWDGQPTWCHCDLDLRNVVFHDGRPS